MITEASFQKQVIDLAQLCGWLVHAERPARTKDGSWRTPIQGMAGWPDLVLVRERVLFVELKSARGTLSPEQEQWRAVLRTAGADARLWRPSDWPEIEATLTQGKLLPRAEFGSIPDLAGGIDPVEYIRRLRS